MRLKENNMAEQGNPQNTLKENFGGEELGTVG